MLEKLFPIKLPPGLFRNGTRYQAQSRWYNSHLVRFISETIRPVGGWRRMKSSVDVDIAALAGKPRGSVSYRGDSGVVRMGIGTHTKAYVLVDGTVTEITPAGFTTGAVDGTYSGGSGNYGSGNYGAGNYGGGALNLTLQEADTWQIDSFGNFLIGCFTADGKLYSWDGNLANDFVQMTGSPTGCRAIVTTPERFVFALGASSDPRLVKWPSQESTTDWTPTAANSAGDFPISTAGRLMAGRRTRRQTLLFTDVDVWTATYIGAPLIYSFDQAGDNCGLLAPNAVSMAGTVAFWMAKDNFFMFDGYVKPIPCDVRDHVFNDINFVQRAKIYSHTISEFNEVWWHYPSAGSLENDRYVVYNYLEDHWTIGYFGRATGVDRGATTSPVMVTHDGFIFEHETLYAFSDTELPYLESGPFEIAGGERLVSIHRVVPDENTLGSVTATLYTSLFPTDTEVATGPFSLSAPSDVRLKARLVRLKLIPTAFDNWRVGIFRLGGRETSRR